MKYGSNKLLEIKTSLVNELSEIYDRREAVNILDILIESFFNLSRIDMAMYPEYRLSESEMLLLHRAGKELLNHKPVQYITGMASFMSLNLKINKAVLIPRQETEELTVKIISAESNNLPLKIIDIGTGSGCIALALKREFSDASVTALDISADALKIANENSFANKLEVNFVKMNIFDKMRWQSLGYFDVIVSNPPYVTISEKSSIQKNVLKYEPEIALFVPDDNPLLFYNIIVSFALQNLMPGGRLYFEINDKCSNQIVKLLNNNGFIFVEKWLDINGKERFVKAVKN